MIMSRIFKENVDLDGNNRSYEPGERKLRNAAN